MYKAIDIANWFLCNIDRESGESITHLKLQKLLYYAQAWYMVLSKTGEPLFGDEIQAWTHGPVVSSIYKTFAQHGFDSIPIPLDCESLDSETEHILNEVLRVYGKFDAKYLELLTHQEEPWIKTRNGISIEVRCDQPISLSLIKQYYQEMYESNA